MGTLLPSLLLSPLPPAPGARHVDFAFWRPSLELSPLGLPLTSSLPTWHQFLPGNRKPGILGHSRESSPLHLCQLPNLPPSSGAQDHFPLPWVLPVGGRRGTLGPRAPLPSTVTGAAPPLPHRQDSISMVMPYLSRVEGPPWSPPCTISSLTPRSPLDVSSALECFFSSLHSQSLGGSM